MKLVDKIQVDKKKDAYIYMKNERPLYLYGAGNLAEILYKELSDKGINIEGCIVDRGFEKKFRYNLPIWYMDEIRIESNKGKFDLLIANAANYQKKQDLEKEHFWGQVLTIANPFEHHKHFDYSFIKDNLNNLNMVYQKLADEESREVFVGFLNGRINEDEKYIKECRCCSGSEFQNDVLRFNDNEVFIDIGAYQGAGIKRFIDAVEGVYKKVIGIEAEEKNYLSMVNNLGGIPSDKKLLINYGCWKEPGVLQFNGEADKCCRIDKEAKTKIKVDKVDNLCKDEQISCVSLGIATFELEIMQGMRQLIESNRPKMIIFLGSAKEELYQLPEYIFSKFDNYDLYLRFQTGMLSRLFLYAIPHEKSK